MKQPRKIAVLIAALALAGCTTTLPDGTVVRDPTGNALLSLFVLPGVGQFCNEQPGKGTLMLVGHLACFVTAVSEEDPDKALPFWILDLGICIWSGIDAYNVSKQYNARLGASAFDFGVAPALDGKGLAAGMRLRF